MSEVTLRWSKVTRAFAGRLARLDGRVHREMRVGS